MQENSPPDSRTRPPQWGRFAAVGAAGAYAALVAAAPRVAGLLANSAAVAAPAAALALAIGAPVAVVLAKTAAPGRRAAATLLGALVLLPVHVTASAWMAALGDQGGAPALLAGDGPAGGWLVGYGGAIFLHAVAAAPWAVLLSAAALRSVDPAGEEAALLDLPAWRVVLQVTLRAAAPALAAIGVLLAVLAAAEMTVTDLLRVRTFAEEVYTQAAAGELLDPTAGGSWRLGLGVAVLGLAAAAAVSALVDRLHAPPAAPGRKPWRIPLARPGLASAALLVATGLLVLLPVVALAYRAGGFVVPVEGGVERSWSAAKLATSVALAPWQHRRELGVSLSLAAAVATAAVVLGGAVAWAMRGSRRFAGLACVGLSLLLAVPGPVVGLAVIRLLNQPLDSPLAWLGDLYGTWFAPWLAQLVRITPAAALVLWPAALRVPRVLLEAARVDGAGPWGAFALVAAPLMAPALAAVWLAAFALSLGELSATILVTPPGTPPLSVRLLSLLHYGVEDRVAAICLVLMAGYTLVALAAGWLLSFASRTPGDDA